MDTLHLLLIKKIHHTSKKNTYLHFKILLIYIFNNYFKVFLQFWKLHTCIQWNIISTLILPPSPPVSSPTCPTPNFMSLLLLWPNYHLLVLPISKVWSHSWGHGKLTNAHVLNKEWFLYSDPETSPANNSLDVVWDLKAIYPICIEILTDLISCMSSGSNCSSIKVIAE